MVKRTHRHVFQLHGDVESCEVTKWLFILNKRTNMLILCVVHEEQKYNAQITYCKQAQKPLNLTNNALMNQASFHEHCGSRGKADLLSFLSSILFHVFFIRLHLRLSFGVICVIFG